jgi:hypothetical protein
MERGQLHFISKKRHFVSRAVFEGEFLLNFELKLETETQRCTAISGRFLTEKI